MKQAKLLAAVGFAGLLFAQTSARADVVFDFATLGPDSPPALGTTQPFTAGGITITAAGFNYAESGGHLPSGGWIKVVFGQVDIGTIILA